MGVYLNGIEYNVIGSNKLFNIEINPYSVITNGLKLFTSDNYILKDINGVYLGAIEYIPITTTNKEILLDIENNYLQIRKG